MPDSSATSLVSPLLGFLGLVIVALIGAFVSIRTQRSEKTQTSETTVDKTLASELTLMGQRIVFKDEQIEFLEDQRDAAIRERDEARNERDRLQVAIDAARAEEQERLNGRDS